MDTLRRQQAGFTLTEIMIALGVLVVGMGMVAGAFHAGIQNHTQTTDDIMRSMVGENAIAIARARLEHEGNTITTTPMLMANIGRNDTMYPVGIRSGRGYLIYGERVQMGRNDYIFRIIPYQVESPRQYVSTSPIAGATISTSGATSQVGVSRAQARSTPLGAKIVLPIEGSLEIGTVVEKGKKSLTLDTLFKDEAQGTHNVTVLVVKVGDGDPDDPIVDVAPRFGVQYLGRCALGSTR